MVKQRGRSSRYRPRLFTELAQQYEAAAAEAQAAGTLITKKNIFHPISLVGYHPEFTCNESDLRYCPQYQVGTVNKIRLTVTNRDPTILIKAESTSVTEGQSARFILERRWATDLLALAPPQSHTVVYLRASQDGQYITGALPTQITFGQNETRKVIELQTVDDSAFGDNGSVTIELLPDTSTVSENLHGKYTIWENWVGHTPAGGRSDKATVTITNNDDKPGITIAPASASEGDSGSANMTFTLTLGQAVSQDVTVNYVTSDGTATAGQDYTAVTNGTTTIPANSTSTTFTVSVTGDTTDEPNETFNVAISLPEPDPDLSDGGGASPPEVAIVGGDTATVSGTIVDDDPVVVTVAPKAASVVEGQDAVFVLTRTGHTDDALSMRVRLSAPGKVETLSAEFDAAATTTELTVATADNDLVDYPPEHLYTIEVLGDGDTSGGDDDIYTPGNPSQATVTATDNDKLQIITVHPHVAFVREGGDVRYVFRRTGDTSEELIFSYAREARQAETTSYEDYNFVNETFPAGVSEITTGALLNGATFPSDQVVNRLYPYTFTAQVYGDGHRYGLHRIWKAGTPDTATIAYYDDDRTRDTVLLAKYPNLVQVGQTISIDFELLNTGSEATGNTITVSSVQLAVGDRNQTKPAEPRAGCSISGPLATGEKGTCRATFTLTAQDLTNSPMVLDATASDGTTTSSTQRIYITVLGGVAVGFNTTTRLSVTEPANGAANAQAVLAVTRVGESDEQVQVAYTVEPIRTQNRPYPAEEGADYVDNSATPGILTFAPNETEKNITIDILGDEIDEQREQFRVTLVPPEGVLVEAAKRNRAVAIVNRDPPSGESYLPTASLELVSADPTPESAGSVDFAVVLDRVWGEDARFEVELDAHDNLTATPAFSRLGQTGDFEAPDGLIHATIPAGQTRFEFSLTLYDDDVREEDETFQMLLGSSIISSQRQIGDEDEVLVTIADDDLVEPTGIELALTSNNGVFDSVAENSSQHNITATASFSDIRWPTDAANAALRPADPRDVDTTVRVEFDSANSAAAQTDLERFQVADSQGTFQDVESFDIVIPAGQTSGTTTLRFKPANDDVDEEDETVTLQGTEVVAADSNEFLPVSSASFTITDDDTRGITISPAKLAAGTGISMKEGGTSTYSLVLDSEPTDTVTVTVAGRQGDLISLTPETLTFTPSDWSTAKTISVVSLDDGTDTSFTNAVISHQVSGGDYGSVTVREIWVQIENTTQAYIYLDDAQASESDGHLEFTVSVRPILRTVPVVVRYATVDGTAVAGTDYTREVTTDQTYNVFSIPANRDTGIIRIPITDNQVYGPAKKTFTLQLTNQNNKASLDGDATPLTATGSIIDDDPKPVVSVAGPAGDLSYVSEDKKGPVTFTLTLTGRSAADVTVDYATGQAQVLSGLAARQGITPATAGEDYTAATGIVTFSPGDATKQVTVQLTDDDVSEDTEFFGFKISNAKNAQLRNDATEEVADVGLLDDDPRGVAIDPTSISLEEPAPGETAVASSYTVQLNSKPTDTVTVTVGGANPAVSLSGATLSNTNTLTFTTSNWDTAQTVTVTPIEDANGLGETITLTHIQSGGDYTGIAADSVTVNVTDSDTRNVVLSPTSLTVKERDDTGVSYTVKLSTQPSDTITVTIGGHSGTDLSISGATLSNSNTLTFSTSNWNTAQTVTVKAGHDGNSDDESETLTHTASGGDYANLTKDLPVTVTDDAPATVTVSFGAASYTVAESDDSDTTNVTENTVEVTVTLSADPERTVVIPISKTNQGGATTADYTGVPQNVTFDSGDTSKSFTFTAAHDTVDDDSESVKLSFGATLPDGVSVGTTDEATVSITDDDVPSVTVSFGSAVYTVAESDDSDTTNVTENTVEVTVTLSADPERTVVIPIEKTNQNGATITDYTGVPQNVTFDSGDTSKSFTFTAAHDTVDDDGESVKLSFGASLPAGVSAGTTDEATVSITDDDVPSVTVSFGSAVYTVAESDDSDTTNVTENTVEVTVTLSADPERTVVIPIEKTNQNGATTADYSGVPTSLTFSSGDTEKTFVFTAETDTDDDDGESVKLSFGATLPDGVTAGTPATSTVTITDDDDPQVTVTFGAASYTVAEGSSRTVTVTLDADPERTVVIPIEKTNQGGASDSDYTGVPQSVTFEAGDTSKTFDISATEDNLAESGERVKLSFGTLPTDATAVTPSETTVSIHDRTQGQDLPTPPTVHFENATYSVDEGASTSIKVILSKAPGSEAVIPISRANRAGATDPDYSGVPDTLTFGATDTEKTITFVATDDTVDDDGEKVELSFGTLPGSITATSGEASEAVVTITDDDATAKAIVLSPASITVEEENATGTTYTVKLASQPSGDVTVIVSGLSGTDLIISGTTLNANDELTLTFTTSDWSAAQTVTVKAAHDADPFGDTAFLLHRATGGGYDSASKTLPVTVTDNDSASIVLSPASITVEEENATGTTYTVKLSHAPTSAVTVTISGHDGTALTISRTALSNDTLTFTSTNWDTAQTVTVKADNDDNAVSESLTLTHTPSGGGYSTAADLPVTVTDDETAAIVLSESALTLTEGDDTGDSYTVKLAAQPSGAVTVTIGGHSGTALSVSGTALSATNTLTFTASNWDMAQTVKVKAGEDANAAAESETLTHTASGADYAGVTKNLPVTVEDDAPDTVTVTFGAASYTVAEGSSRTVTVSLDADPERTVVIPIETANQGGASDSDYTGVPQSVTFEAGDTSKSFTFTAADDTVDDDGESVKLSFGASLPAGVSAGTTDEATVSITDDDDPQVTVAFGQSTYSAAEGSTVTVKVTLSADPERTVVIPIEKTNQGGAITADYSGVPTSLTFSSGDTEKTFVFTAETDTVDDDGESVKLSFGASLPAGVSAGTPATSTVTITDDDVPSVTVSFGSAAYTVAESDDSDTTNVTENTVEVTVTLSADPERTVVIPIEKTNQNGATTADYTGVPQNVTFDSGETSKSFTFTAAHDTVDDDGESVKLSFGTMPDARVSPGATDELSLSITDDDDPQVTVAFGQSTYSAAEGSTVTVEVTLSADPERNVSIPIEKTNEGGAIAADYTGVPQSVTFDAGETLKSFVFTAETDTDDDHGESVRLSFDTMPDARVSKGSPSEAMVTIRQDSTQSTADCNSAIWCADLEFKSQSLPGEMWVLDDKPLDSEFDYNGVTYRFGGLSVDPYGHNIPINGRPNPPFAIPERTKFNLRLLNMSASGYSLDRFRMPNDDWMNWTLHVSTAKDGETLTAALPLSEGRFSEHYWIWHGSDLEALRLAWMEGQVYKLKIVEDPRSQRTPKVLGPPLYLKVTPYTNHTLGAWWKMPENRVDRAPPNTTYKVQWKEASDSWDNPADVSEETDSPSPATKETLFHSIRGLTGGVEYHVRVIATNTVGDSEPSEVVSGTPTPLQAAGQNIAANSPTKGAPSIEGTPEVGQTLSAVTTDITDDDGLQDVVFSYQWLADDVEISGADGATYILTSDDLGKAINVRVDFTDNAGNEESLTSAPTAAVTAAEDLELQSATVDGSTLTLTYNETLDTSVTLPASAFVVNVNEASRSIMGAGVGGSSVLLLLSSAVETGDTVTVDYTAPDGQDFIRDSQGRKAESFSGQEVTNNTASSGTPRTIPPPAPGAPNSLKVARHESGKLLASWSAPNSGPAPTGYTLQWKESGDDWDDADDVSEANVKGTSHVITGLTDGVQYAVRVIAYKGDAESDPSGEVTATPQETVAPSPSAASVDGATLTVTFDEALAEVQAPASTAFAVTVAGNSRGVSAVAVSGSAVTLTLVTAVFAGEAVTVDYTVPTGESAVGLQDVSGNAAASFSGQQVTNDTQAAAQLTASVSVVPESHDGGTVFTFELRFSETPRKRFSYKIMRDLAFTVTGGEVTGARRLAPRSNVGWEIHVRPDGNGPVTIVLPVTTDCTAEGAICTEDRRPLSNRLEITVPAPGG